MPRILRQAASAIRQALVPRYPSQEHVVLAIRIFVAMAVVVGTLILLVRFGLVTSENAAVVGALIALIGVVITQVVNTRIAQSNQLKQQELETGRAQAEQELETGRAQAARFQAYLEQMGKLLIDHQLGNSDPSSNHSGSADARVVAQALTMAVLKGETDPTRKRILLLFLYDSALINKDNPVISLSTANLKKTDLSGAHLEKVNLRGANLSGADLSEADLSEADLSEVDLSQAVLQWAGLNQAILIEANLRNAKQLGQARLVKADLNKADLREVDLREGTLWTTWLKEADLRGADLSSATMRNSDLSRTELSGAKLCGVRFAELSNLIYADLGGANLSGADLRQTTGLKDKQIIQANGDETTKLPDHLQRPAHWSKGDEEESKEEGGGDKR